MAERARQFMPFAALRGFYSVIEERERIRSPRRELGEDDCNRISSLLGQLERGMMIKVIHYNDGFYETTEGLVAEVDFIFRYLVIVKTKIMFDDIFDISSKELAFDIKD